MADSKSGMNLPSRTSTVLTDLRGGISGGIQDTVRLKQEWTSLGQVIQGIGSKAGSLFKGMTGGGQQSSSKIAPDANFAQGQKSENNEVFSSPAQKAIGGGEGGGGGVGGGGGGPAAESASGGGNGMFRNISEYISQNKTGAILYGAGTALGGAHATSDMVQAQLLMQRTAAFMPKDPGLTFDQTAFGTGGGSRYEYARRSATEMANMGGANDKMDAFNAFAAAQSYGINGPNFMQRAGTDGQFGGSVMGGIANVSNLVPGMGLEGTTRAYGGMQRGRTVNMLKGVGINIRDEQGNMKPMDVIIDDLWTKICRDVSKDGRGKPTEQDMLIGFQPGNSMDSMVQNLFGDDPLVYTAIKNGLIYKAKTGGAAITKQGAHDSGMTTSAVQTTQNKNTLGTQGLGQVSNVGAFTYQGVQSGLNDIAKVFLTKDAASGPLGGDIKALNAFAALMQTLGGAGGGAGNSFMQFILAMLGFRGKAAGGDVGNAQPYMVGEKGPELFIPKTDGVIIPNDLGPTRHAGGGVSARGHSHTWGKNSIERSKVKDILAKAGFTGRALEDALQISRGESGYNPYAFNGDEKTGDKSYGLMQINMLGALGPGRRKWFNLKNDEDLYDPLTNAKAAYSLYKSKGYRFDRDWVKQSKKLADKGHPGGGFSGTTPGGNSFTSDSSPSSSVGNSSTDPVLSKIVNETFGATTSKAYEEWNNTRKLPDANTMSTILSGMGLSGSQGNGMAEAIQSLLNSGAGMTNNYGGVTFNITTPADNKSFLEAIKKALGDLNIGKLIAGK